MSEKYGLFPNGGPEITRAFMHFDSRHQNFPNRGVLLEEGGETNNYQYDRRKLTLGFDRARGGWFLIEDDPNPDFGDIVVLDGNYVGDGGVVAGPGQSFAPGDEKPDGSGLVYEGDEDDGAGGTRYSDRWIRPDLRRIKGS